MKLKNIPRLFRKSLKTQHHWLLSISMTKKILNPKEKRYVSLCTEEKTILKISEKKIQQIKNTVKEK